MNASNDQARYGLGKLIYFQTGKMKFTRNFFTQKFSVYIFFSLFWGVISQTDKFS